MNPVLLFLLYMWSLIWKGLALWKSAQNKKRNWFIAILVLNTFGILEILYLFVFSTKRLKIAWKLPK